MSKEEFEHAVRGYFGTNSSGGTFNSEPKISYYAFDRQQHSPAIYLNTRGFVQAEFRGPPQPQYVHFVEPVLQLVVPVHNSPKVYKQPSQTYYSPPVYTPPPSYTPPPAYNPPAQVFNISVNITPSSQTATTSSPYEIPGNGKPFSYRKGI